jgi:hypothetical protein
MGSFAERTMVRRPTLQGKRFARWKADYDIRQRDYATCRLLGDVGSGNVHPEVGRVVELHDFVTRCSASLALA